VTALLLKLTLAPALVAAATHVARRVGHRTAGLVSGLPVVAGPIALIYAVEQGEAFARVSAAAAVLGITSSVAFCTVYALVALHAQPPAALVASSAAFACMTLAFDEVDPPLAVNAAVTLTAIAAGSWLVARLVDGSRASGPRSDLLAWRLAITIVLVLAVTAAAGSLSAHLAGLLIPLPVITAVMAGFTHARAGAPATVEMLGGLVLALASIVTFFVTLAATLGSADAATAFALASLASLACWGVLTLAVRA